MKLIFDASFAANITGIRRKFRIHRTACGEFRFNDPAPHPMAAMKKALFTLDANIPAFRVASHVVHCRSFIFKGSGPRNGVQFNEHQTNNSVKIMKKHLVSSVAIASVMAVAAYAGTSDNKDKVITQPVTEVDFGVGPYVAVDGGLNALQEHIVNMGDIAANSNIGGFGGVKAGYVFNTGVIRPAVELEGFYNGFSQDIIGSGEKFDVNSAVYVVNGLCRFALGRWQPYVGAGMGGYSLGGHVCPTPGNPGGSSTYRTSMAWQLIGGLDYYICPKMSIFAEYKWLNFEDAGSFSPSGDRFGQQLVGAGVRVHF